MSGWIAIAGIGPGDDALITPEVTAALAEATDIVGYWPALLDKKQIETTVRVEVS